MHVLVSLMCSSVQVLLLILVPFGGVFVRDGQCPEYSGEDQAICAVGLAKCKPGVFVEAIHYLLVLATPSEVLEYYLDSQLVLLVSILIFFIA